MRTTNWGIHGLLHRAAPRRRSSSRTPTTAGPRGSASASSTTPSTNLPSGCGFLTLSLRLVPSVDGFLLILLHALTVAAVVAGCAVIAAPDPPRGRVYTAHMSGTVVVSILQGAAAVLAFWELLTGEGLQAAHLLQHLRREGLGHVLDVQVDEMNVGINRPQQQLQE
ncbi:hypothetical protein ZWY2020_048230 [Hordeum vulgare]|nr:hypothetical protein ZWY2020_048230 [Hordeum vulgare]